MHVSVYLTSQIQFIESVYKCQCDIENQGMCSFSLCTTGHSIPPINLDRFKFKYGRFATMKNLSLSCIFSVCSRIRDKILRDEERYRIVSTVSSMCA